MQATVTKRVSLPLFAAPHEREVQAGDMVRLYLDERVAGLPNFIVATIQLPILKVEKRDCYGADLGRIYKFGYETNDLPDFGKLLHENHIVGVVYISSSEILAEDVSRLRDLVESAVTPTIVAGVNVFITGTGTFGDPYVISASGGSGGGGNPVAEMFTPTNDLMFSPGNELMFI